MATRNDTSKPRRSRRDQRKASAASVEAPPLAEVDAPPPRTLEEAIEDVRTLMLQVRALLHCLSEVLLYSDDDDGVMHADVARSAAALASDAAVKLDLVNLKPLIEAIRQRGGGTPSDGQPGLTSYGPYQVREPAAVYLV